MTKTTTTYWVLFDYFITIRNVYKYLFIPRSSFNWCLSYMSSCNNKTVKSNIL